MRLRRFLVKLNLLQKNKIKFPFSYFIVKDWSMEPAFYDNDRVFTFNFGNIKTGSVVVFKLGELYDST